MTEDYRAYFERINSLGLLPKTEEVTKLLKQLGLEDLINDND